MNYAAGTILSGLGALAAVLLAGFSHDELFRIHMWILFAVLGIFTILLLRNADYSLSPKKSEESVYMDGPIRYGLIATVFWGITGFLVGVVIAAQLAFPDLNFEPYLNFGRVRPLHTSAVIFAFCGNALICTSFYVVQRTCRARLFGGDLAWFVFWGYNLFIVMAATG